MPFGRASIAAPRGDASLCVLPPVFPEGLAVFGDIGLLQTKVVTLLVPLPRRIQVAGIDADACGFVGHLTLLVKGIMGLFLFHP